MKILLTMNIPYFPARGGANKANRYLLEGLAGKGHSIKAVTPALGHRNRDELTQLIEDLTSQKVDVTRGKEADVFNLSGVQVHAVREPSHLRSYLAQSIATFQPDWVLVSSEDPSQNLLATALKAAPLRVIYLAHSMSFLPFGPWAFFPSESRRKLFKQTAAIISVSEFVQGYIRQWGGLDSTVFYWPAYGPGPYPYFSNFDHGYVTMVNPCAVKGISIFLDLASSMKEVWFAAVPTWGTTEEDLTALRRQPNIRLLESSDDIDDILAQTRVLLVPSLWGEGLSLIIIEAMLRGIPVLASDSGGNLEAKLGTDFVIPVNSIESFTESLDANMLPVPNIPKQDISPWRGALASLLSDRNLYHRHAQGARKSAQGFVSGLSVAPFEDLLERLASKSANTSGQTRAQSSGMEMRNTTPAAAKMPENIADLTPEQRAVLMRWLRNDISPRGEEKPQTSIIERVPRNGLIPLSFAQQRLWFIHQLDADSSVYNNRVAVRLRGKLVIGALRGSLQEITRRHEVLRTRFVSRDEQPVQLIDEPGEVEAPVWDLSELEEKERSRQMRELITQGTRRPFDLEHGPVWRIALLRLSPEDHLLMVCIHHVATDGWSAGIMVREFTTLYKRYQEGRYSTLPELPLQYADFALWQRQWLQGEILERQLEYWRNRLAGATMLELPTDRPRPAVASHRGASVEFRLPAGLTQGLSALSRRERGTLFITLLAAFQALLARYSGQQDILVGTSISGRNRVETEGLIGFFLNTLVMRTDLSGDPTVKGLLARVRETAVGAYAHQDLPFEKLVEELQPERSLSHEPFFQVMLTMQNAPRADAGFSDPHILRADRQVIDNKNITANAGLSDLRIVHESPLVETTKYDLTLLLSEVGGELHGSFEYSTDLYDKSRIMRLFWHFRRVLEAMQENSNQRLAEIHLLSAAERQQVVVEWNVTEIEYETEQSLSKLFERQAELKPDAVAVGYEEQQISYAELTRRVNQLASYLRGLEVRPEVRVGLHLKRSLEMVVGLLGVLKAGGAYVPLDPNYPAERLAFMLDDAQATVLLSHSRVSEKLPGAKVWRLELDREWEMIENHPLSDQEFQIRSENLAYLIYTSGSSGLPKGVMITHGGLTNYLLWAAETYRVSECSASVVHSSISFDLTITGLLTPLLCGVEVRLVEDVDAVGAVTKVAEISDCNSLVKLTPGQLSAVREGLRAERALNFGKLLVIGGEALTWDELEYWRTHAHSTRLINEYGPTETVVGCCVYEAAGEEQCKGPVPIGRPIANTRLYVVDKYGEVDPAGVSGELFIGGAGLGRGYWKQEELTAERFVPDWMSEESGGRLYQTGDRVRWRADGRLEYLGRLDEQVKVRGYRIELEEIESALATHIGVKQCAVCLREDQPGDKRLIAYIVPSGEKAPTKAELRAHLQEKLPEYMIPAVFAELSELPLTPNGKLNRKALPAPQSDTLEQVLAPRESNEIQLFQIWSEILRRDDFGVRDNFFDLGGHSFAAIAMASRVSEIYKKRVSIKTVYESPTIELLARYLMREVAVAPPSVIVPIQPRGTRRPFFGVHPGGGLAHYYIPLSRCLDKDQPFYGLQVHGLEVGQTPLSTVEEMASIYLAEVRRIQPIGPYRIGGYSFGALVAYEMAQQLYAAEEEVSLLVIIDAGPPRENQKRHDLSELDILEPKPAHVIRWLKLFGFQVDENEINSMPLPDFAERYMDRHGITGDLNIYLQLYRAAVASRIAKYRYQPRPYPGRITLFRGNNPGEHDLRWGQLAPGNVDVYCFDVGHQYMLSDQNIPALAAQLSSCLAAVDRTG